MNERILIVEDENDTAELLGYNLQRAGYETLRASTGKEAIDAAQRHAPGLILLDIMLPELSGWEVCRLLRESPQGRSIPIIMLTALADEEARIKGLSLGADDYITKPFSVRELLIKVNRHIERQRTISDQLQRHREQETSMSYLVHELKNAVSIIGGFSSLALQKQDRDRYLRSIQASAMHADSLLTDANLLARLEQKGATLPVEPLDINSVMQEVIDLFVESAGKNGVELASVGSAPHPVMANATATRQVLMNLVSNAIKFSETSGRVWVFCEETKNGIDVSVTDEGAGIPPAELPRIFDKYFRGAGSERVKGAGLGLYIVRLLLSAMGGTIKAVSKPGAGSTFTASFRKIAGQENEQETERDRSALLSHKSGGYTAALV